MKKAIQIAIIGYGKMGREIEKHARAQNLTVTAIVDTPEDWEKHAHQIQSADVAIEFTAPEVVVENLKKLFEMGVPVVTGTTGWNQHYELVKSHCEKCNGGLFYASNFSIGVNLFFALNRHMAKLMNDYSQYKVAVEESHHKQKLDAPSGTAISLLDDIIAIHPKYKRWQLVPQSGNENSIPVTAIREEGVTGIHSVKYESEIDSITINHTANNRDGFALGALMAAKWIQGKKGIYTMRDLLNL